MFSAHNSTRVAKLLSGLAFALLCLVYQGESPVYSQGGSTPLTHLAGDSHTLLLLHFDDTLTGVDRETPTQSINFDFRPGIFGAAVFLPQGNQLHYASANNINPVEGSLEFWIKPAWSGNDGQNHHVLRYGAGGGMLIGKDAANNLRIILNRFGGAGGEVGTAVNVANWVANEWHHLAFTWSSSARTVNLYVDGRRESKATFSSPLPPISSTSFQLGGDGNGSYLNAVVDELRISDVERSPQEIAQSFTEGIAVSQLTMNPSSSDLLETWVKTPTLTAVTNLGVRSIPPAAAVWTSSDPSVAEVDQNGRVLAVAAGAATVTATVQGVQADLAVTIRAPVLPPTIEPIDPYLSTPAGGHLYEIPVVIINYLPTTDGVNVDTAVTNWTSTLEALKTRVNRQTIQSKFMLEEGSRFRGYGNPAALPSLGYRVVRVITVYEELPTGFAAPGNPNLFFPDYNQILNRFGAENYVRNLGVKEFWIWGYHHGNIVPAESNMSSPTTGDISNSNRFQDDLPVYDRTYTVYNYNFTRSAAEATHNHGHQLEAILSYANQRQDGNTTLFWRKFVGQNQNGNFITGRCGWTHMPPNTTADYDYANMTTVNSDIEDWTPDGIGQSRPVNASTWGTIPYAWPDNAAPAQLTESKWYVYWMQNMPGRGNTIPYGQNRMTNWWAFTADWDASINAQLGLYESAACSYSISTTAQSFDAGGGTGSVDVSAGASCARIATSNVAWITITSGAGGSGDGMVDYSVAANNNPTSRTGTVTIAGHTLTVTQAGGGTAGLQYYPLERPVRLLDTRPGQPACDAPGTPLAGGSVRSENARLTCGGMTIPADAQAIVGNATVVNTVPGATSGFVTLYPGGASRPTASNLNYVAEQVVPNAFTVGLGGDGAFEIYASSSTHFIVDVTGYYGPPRAGGLYYHPLPSPVRLLDTRPGQPACDAPGAPLSGGASRTQTARVTCHGATIPTGAKVIVGNATVVNAGTGAAAGYITLYPSGSTLPTASNLNYVPGQIVPNAFTVGLGDGDGAFQIYASSPTDFIVDVTGYYSDQVSDLNGTGLLYNPLANPVRLLDTRPGQAACDAPGAPLMGGASRVQPARTACSTVPDGAQVVVGNATAVNTAGGAVAGYITLYPSGASLPTVSSLNYVPGQIVPNAFTVGLGNGDGAFQIFASSSTHFIVDITGYFFLP